MKPTKQDALIKKLEREYNQFRNHVLGLSKEQIFDRACEITAKEDIKGYIESEELSPNKINQLLSYTNPLDALYMLWLKQDTTKSDEMDNLLWYMCDYLPKKTNEDSVTIFPGNSQTVENTAYAYDDEELEDDFEM